MEVVVDRESVENSCMAGCRGSCCHSRITALSHRPTFAASCTCTTSREALLYEVDEYEVDEEYDRGAPLLKCPHHEGVCLVYRSLFCYLEFEATCSVLRRPHTSQDLSLVRHACLLKMLCLTIPYDLCNYYVIRH